jgi:hypothetical protein
MSYAYNDGQGREVWASSGVGLSDLVRGFAKKGRGYTPPRFSKDDQKLLEQGQLYQDTSRYSGKTAPVLTLEEKNQGYRWEQAGSRTVAGPSFGVTNVAGRPTLIPRHMRKDREVPIWQKMGGSSAAAAEATPDEPFTPSQDLVDAKTRAQTYQSGSGGAGSGGSPFGDRTPNFNLSGGDLFNELWAQGASQGDAYQQRFIPQLQANALLNSAEIGEATKYHLGRFAGKVDDIADARESFNYYLGKVDPKAAKRTTA